jgi:predicted RNase H-like nuclease
MREHMTWVAGVDGCRAGWIVALVKTGSKSPQPPRVKLCSGFVDVLNLQPRPSVIAVDIPIGLLDVPKAGGRTCDQEARRALGRRASSIFSPPIRTWLDAGSYEHVRSLGMTRQSFGILSKIREVDRLMIPQLQESIYEAHPELAFCTLATGKPTRENKKTPAGREERLRRLEHVPGKLFRTMRRDLAVVSDGFTRKQVAPDDILDACVLAWTAVRIAEGRAKRFPHHPGLDRKGLRMEIWS